MHGARTAWWVMGEDVVEEPAPAGGAPEAAPPPQSSLLKFGRLLDRMEVLKGAADGAMIEKLTALGECMNDPERCDPQSAPEPSGESDIPSGYTYLGQFIAHEVTFDDSNDTLRHGIDPNNLRTPQVDLDGLYGGPKGPRDPKYAELYEADGIRLKVGMTERVIPPTTRFPNDLPRAGELDKENPKRALIADPRNDENLPLAQTHVAFIRFHNRVVERLRAKGHRDDGLFECARRQVVRHFQWLILEDYLPRIVDKAVLERVRAEGAPQFEKAAVGPFGPTMPLEFSAAAFRIGHTMVRREYDWNKYHDSARTFGDGPAHVHTLFGLTGFRRPRPGQSGTAASGFSTSSTKPEGVKVLLKLPGDWIIDWRRFYQFPQAPGGPPQPRVNMASKLDTVLNFQLEKLEGFSDATLQQGTEAKQLKKIIKAITVRNLLRGYFLGLPTGEEVARRLGLEPIKPGLVAEGPHESILSDPLLSGQTPLWYYILKEAQLLGKNEKGEGGHRLGPVGSRIVAETFVGLIRHSPHSILDEPGWRPKFGPSAEGDAPAEFKMTDLLTFAFGAAAEGEHSVNPVGL